MILAKCQPRDVTHSPTSRIVMILLLQFCVLPFAWMTPSLAQALAASSPSPRHEGQVNLNTASIEDLMRLPGIGAAIAARIVEYRRKHGRFKRPQDIIIVRGMSASRYRQIAHLIRI